MGYDSEMSARAKDLLRDALELPLDQRAELAADLLASMDGAADADVEAAWGAEIERRARQALSGQTEPIPWETVRDQALDKITRR
jgi:putative addiction module component (TIGR02574 family)